MGETVGFVTRTAGGRTVSMGGSPGVVAPQSRNQFVAKKADGTLLGADFSSIRDAQRAVEASVGSGLLRWERSDLVLDIEHWAGSKRDFWPGDLNAPNQGTLTPATGLLNGGLWVRADKARRLAPAAPPPSTELVIRRWQSLDGSGTITATAASGTSPTFAGGDDTTTGRPAARFSPGDFMSTTLTGFGPTYSVHAVVSFAGLGAGARYVITIGAEENFSLFVNASNEPTLIVDSTTLSASAVTAGDTFLLTAVHHATDVDFFVNGVLIGTVVDVAASGTCVISNATAGDSWDGDIFELIVVPDDLNTVINEQIINYALDHYGIAA